MNKDERIKNIELLAELENVQKTLQTLSAYVDERLDEADEALEGVIQRMMEGVKRV